MNFRKKFEKAYGYPIREYPKLSKMICRPTFYDALVEQKCHLSGWANRVDSSEGK